MVRREPGEWVPDVPARLEAVERHLEALHWVGWEPREARPAIDSEIELVHSAGHVARIRDTSEAGGAPLDAENWVGAGGYVPSVLADCVRETMIALADEQPAPEGHLTSGAAAQVGAPLAAGRGTLPWRQE
jgi:hypothetical protein